MKTVLVIAYLMGGHVIDTERLDAASMEECEKTRQAALSGVTPVTAPIEPAPLRVSVGVPLIAFASLTVAVAVML